MMNHPMETTKVTTVKLLAAIQALQAAVTVTRSDELKDHPLVVELADKLRAYHETLNL